MERTLDSSNNNTPLTSFYRHQPNVNALNVKGLYRFTRCKVTRNLTAQYIDQIRGKVGVAFYEP